jgi:hypothetical protein
MNKVKNAIEKFHEKAVTNCTPQATMTCIRDLELVTNFRLNSNDASLSQARDDIYLGSRSPFDATESGYCPEQSYATAASLSFFASIS